MNGRMTAEITIELNAFQKRHFVFTVFFLRFLCMCCTVALTGLFHGMDLAFGFCRHSDSIVSEDAGIEPRTIATIRRSDRSDGSHYLYFMVMLLS
jgi:hypothetical protein